MIISHRHRFLFVAIPKTGTHSVRQALRAHLAEDDLEQVGLFVNRRFPFADLAAIRHGHLSLRQVQPVLQPGQFESYFKFAFVRNPFDRFVSYCAFMSRDSGQFASDARGFMKQVLFQVRPEQHILFQPQHLLLTDADGDVLSDYVGRVEEMQAGYDQVCRQLGFESAPLGRVNSSQRGDYREYYDAELIAGVSEYYRRDLELFSYSFDPDASQSS
jgi:hypothetical protein